MPQHASGSAASATYIPSWETLKFQLVETGMPDLGLLAMKGLPPLVRSILTSAHATPVASTHARRCSNRLTRARLRSTSLMKRLTLAASSSETSVRSNSHSASVGSHVDTSTSQRNTPAGEAVDDEEDEAGGLAASGTLLFMSDRNSRITDSGRGARLGGLNSPRGRMVVTLAEAKREHCCKCIAAAISCCALSARTCLSATCLSRGTFSHVKGFRCGSRSSVGERFDLSYLLKSVK